MFMLVCYDIHDDRRRNRIGKILEGYGRRVQWSVFECDLTTREADRLKQKLTKVIRDNEDSVRYYRLCAHCLGQVEVVNGPPPIESQLCYVV